LLIDTLGWRWVFFIAVPFGVIGTLLAWLILPTTTRETGQKTERFDWLGAALLAPGIALVLLGLTFGNSWGWTSPMLVLVLTLAVIALAVLWRAEASAVSPLVEPTLLRNRVFTLGLLAGLLSYAVLFGSLFLLPFYLERVLGQTPAQAERWWIALAPRHRPSWACWLRPWLWLVSRSRGQVRCW
jgi:predicted MFS family arabinose efflux permease